jgi:rSAM/selenodomain-associated transferase 1
MLLNHGTGMREQQCVLLFIKAPVKGRVKSRLAAAIGEEAALEIYKDFVITVLETLKAGRYPFRIAVYPREALESVRHWLGRDLDYLPQTGKDLGERMKNALARVFSDGIGRAVIIGSDIPDLPDEMIHEAFRSLESKDAVIGPALDGGYYLIGFNARTFLTGAFDGIPWSTKTVFFDTMQVLERSSWTVHQLPPWRDVDTLEDLNDLVARNEKNGPDPSAALSALMRRLRTILPGGP